MKLPKTNTLFLVVASLAVAGGLYWYFFTGSAGDEQPLRAVSQSQAQARFEVLTNELGAISFDLAILSDPRFMALVDLTTPITEEEIGRRDPFAPVPGISSR